MVTEKEALLLLVGLILGIYASMIAGRFSAYFTLQLDALREIQLFPAYLCADSDDLKRIPRADRALELISIQSTCLGHENLHFRCHSIADEMESAIDRAGKFGHPTYIDISHLKSTWLDTVMKANPNWGAVLFGNFSFARSMQQYADKEKQYTEKAKMHIEKYPGSIIPYDKNA